MEKQGKGIQKTMEKAVKTREKQGEGTQNGMGESKEKTMKTREKQGEEESKRVTAAQGEPGLGHFL